MEYKKCLVELDEILNYLKDEDLRKIPYDIRKAINEKKDKQYNWNYDESKDLYEQHISRKTIAMLSYLNMEYLLNKEQKLLMQELHRFNEKKVEKEKFKKYNQDNIFNQNMNNVYKEINEINHENKNKINGSYSDMQMIIKKEDKWYKKIIKAIANIFYKNK